jgi:integrase
MKLKDLLKLYYDKYKTKVRRPKYFQYGINLLCRQNIGNITLIKLNNRHIAEFRDERLDAGKSPSTVKKYLGLISRAFNIGRKELSLPLQFNPVSLVTKPSEPSGRDRILSDKELHRLLETASQSSIYCMRQLIILAIETLCRRSELLNLKRSDVDYSNRTAHIKITKNNTPRSIGLSPLAITTLRALPSTIDGRFINIGSIGGFEKAFKRCVRKTNIKDFRFHDCRHIGATKLAKQGWTVLELAAQGGWKSTSMVKRYANINAEHLAKKFITKLV